MNLTKNFKYEEFAKDTAIPLKYQDNILGLVNLLQILREYIDEPIYITSGYRNKEKNKQVGGVENSQHMTGEAADITCSMQNMRNIVNYLDGEDAPVFDQCIFYRKKGYIHISKKNSGINRNQIIIK